MLQDKTIVVTGANGTLGRAVCIKAEALGAQVIRLDLAFTETSDSSYEVDLTDIESTMACFSSLGEFHGVFNLAGGFDMGTPTWEAGDQQWDTMFKLNVTTLRNSIKASVPALIARGGGAIVNVGAYGAREGQAQMSAYGASKSVVMRLTESLANELREQGINVNAVLPTVIDTPPNRAAMPDVDPATWVSPEDLASVICFLGSDSASAVHGALVPVRGLS